MDVVFGVDFHRNDAAAGLKHKLNLRGVAGGPVEDEVAAELGVKAAGDGVFSKRSLEFREKAAAEKAEHPDWTLVEDSGRGYRRVVASPIPRKIVEADSILNLLDNEFIVIACGGGGVPVVRDYSDKGCYKGVAAVIDKDMAGELLAEDCRADMLVLLTAVDHVAINFGKPDQVDLEDITVEEAKEYLKQGQFGKGSMEPKVRAAIKFAESRPGRTCIIGSLEKADKAISGKSGTRIHM